MKKVLAILFYTFTLVNSYSQVGKPIQCWNITQEKTDIYFANLFGSITGNDPDLAQVRLDFTDGETIYILGMQGVREYCKQKFNLPDSSVKKFTNQFIRDGEKIQLADTILLRKLDNTLNKRHSLFTVSELCKYKSLGVRDFILNNCEGDVLKIEIDVVVLAYFFENRIFLENMTGRIAQSSLRQIEESCGIKWNYKKKKWVFIK